jgi:glycosyltransferase involved in cell wall biosynthesis
VEASVIVPARNAAEHIEQQLLALAAQRTTGVSWELIVADNGSTDDTVAIVERVAAEYPVPVRVVDASDRVGATGARNAGVAAAAGNLLLFTDADDVVDPCWVQEMVSALREHQLVGGRIEVLELNGEEVASWRLRLFDDDFPTVGGRRWVAGANFGCTVAAYDAIGGFDESVSIGEDLDLSLRMHAVGITAVFAARAIVHYRYRNEPRQAVRQMWNYGVSNGVLYARYGLVPPTFLDGVIALYRGSKQAIREGLRRRRPVRPAVEVAFVLGEASIFWRNPAFWRPVTRRYRVANPVNLCWDRLARLASLVGGGTRAKRGD